MGFLNERIADFALQEDPFCTKSKILAKGGVGWSERKWAKPANAKAERNGKSAQALLKWSCSAWTASKIQESGFCPPRGPILHKIKDFGKRRRSKGCEGKAWTKCYVISLRSGLRITSVPDTLPFALQRHREWLPYRLS